jgi:hypothetical protein
MAAEWTSWHEPITAQTLRQCADEIETLRELVREQLDDGRTPWLEWKERAEKALEGK